MNREVKRREVKANELSDVDVRFVSLVKRGANRIPFRLTKEDTTKMLDFVKLFRKSDEEAKPAPSSAPQPEAPHKEPSKEEKDPVLAALARLEEGQRALAESVGQLVAKVQKTDAPLSYGVSSVVLGEANRDQPVRLAKRAGGAGIPRLLDTGLIKL
jgi:hypothetical protein